jgi:very-short-patch-repair endonuclease
MYRELADLAAQQHGVFAYSHAEAHGFSRKQLLTRIHSGEIIAVHNGVFRMAGAPATWHHMMLAAALASGGEGVASHRSAARLWQLDGFSTDHIEITVPHAWGRRLQGVRVHESRLLLAEDRQIVNRIPVTGPELTLLQLGAVAPADMVEHALDDALRRRITSLPRLRWRLTVIGRRGRNGTAALRALLERRAPEVAVPESILERRFLRTVRLHGLPEPLGQWAVPGIGRTDFAWPDHNLVIELDGLRFHSGRRQLQHDLTRQNALVSRGLTVLRFTWDDVHERPERVVKLISSVLASESAGIGLSG